MAVISILGRLRQEDLLRTRAHLGLHIETLSLKQTQTNKKTKSNKQTNTQKGSKAKGQVYVVPCLWFSWSIEVEGRAGDTAQLQKSESEDQTGNPRTHLKSDTLARIAISVFLLWMEPEGGESPERSPKARLAYAEVNNRETHVSNMVGKGPVPKVVFWLLYMCCGMHACTHRETHTQSVDSSA